MPLTLKRMIQNNPVSHAVDLVGEAWTMLILREAFRGARRFDDWLDRLTISRSVLARRLKAMCETGLLEPRLYQTRPERFEYGLTEMGRDLYGVAVMLILWEQDWSPRADPSRAIKLVRRSDGGIELGVELFGDYWTNLVLAACFYRIRRYDDFLANLDISTSVLAERLASLVEHGVLERRLYQTRPERFEYVLTAMGRALYPVVLAFFAWGSRWACGPERTPVVLISNATGAVVEPVLRDAVTGERLDARAVRPAPLHSHTQRQRAAARS